MNWDNYFKNIVTAVAARSKDRSTKVGSIIVDNSNVIRATGYNGFPRGVNDDAEERHSRPEKYLWTEHAERNAIYAAARTGVRTEGCKLYLTWFPCMECARAIIQCGIVEVIGDEPDLTNPQWGENFRKVLVLLAEAGTKVRYYGRC